MVIGSGVQVISAGLTLRAWDVDWMVRARAQLAFRLLERLEVAVAFFTDVAPWSRTSTFSMGLALGARIWVWP